MRALYHILIFNDPLSFGKIVIKGGNADKEDFHIFSTVLSTLSKVEFVKRTPGKHGSVQCLPRYNGYNFENGVKHHTINQNRADTEYKTPVF